MSIKIKFNNNTTCKNNDKECTEIDEYFKITNNHLYLRANHRYYTGKIDNAIIQINYEVLDARILLINNKTHDVHILEIYGDNFDEFDMFFDKFCKMLEDRNIYYGCYVDVYSDGTINEY